MSARQDGMPSAPQMFRARVVRSTRLSESFQRVTIAGESLHRFQWRGFDHWFRLFLPKAGARLVLPEVSGREWWRSYLAIPESFRPRCSNYTVAEHRPLTGELDIDVVLHEDADGPVADPGDSETVSRWATTVGAGSPVAFLDQGVLFVPPADTDQVVIACDETGIPAARGILASLPRSTRGAALLEVPAGDDIAPLAVPRAPLGVQVTWLARDQQPMAVAPGSLALAEVEALTGLSARTYGFVIGESKLATGGRRALIGAGVPKQRIFFSGFWKYGAMAAVAR